MKTNFIATIINTPRKSVPCYYDEDTKVIVVDAELVHPETLILIQEKDEQDEHDTR